MNAESGGCSAVSETPGVCGGFPVVTGTRIPVRIVVAAWRELSDFAAIRVMYPQLSEQQIQAVLDYYAAHPARVDEDFARHAAAPEVRLAPR